MRADPGVQRDAPAAEAMGVDQRRHGAVELRLRQRLHHDIALPGAVGVSLPVLDGAAAAGREMRAKWRDPLRACAYDPEQAAAIGMAGDLLDFGGLAGERVRHIDAFVVHESNAIAAVADMVDRNSLNHGARRGRIRCCRRHP